MVKAKPVQTPLATRFRLSCQQCLNTIEEESEMSSIPYSGAVGCLMYAIMLTRPDISYAVSIVSKHMTKPGNEHWKVDAQILRYLSGTSDYGLLYSNTTDEEAKFIRYADSNYAGDLNKRESITEYLFLYNNYTINQKATLQSVVALSTTKAKYAAAAEATKEAIWLKGMLT